MKDQKGQGMSFNIKNIEDEYIVVTRHKGLIDFLKQKKIINEDTPVYEHVQIDDVKGKHVLGVLPYWLAVHALTVTEISMDLPLSLRGKELSAEEVEQFIKEPVTVQVRTLEQVHKKSILLSDYVAGNSDYFTSMEVYNIASKG